MLKKVEVVIIGGGITGLTAAQELLSADKNISVTVLEARSRLGGRIETARMKNGDIIEMGAHWIHGLTKANKLYPFTMPDELGYVTLKTVPYSYNFIKVLRNGQSYPLKLLKRVFKDIHATRDKLLSDPKNIKSPEEEREYIKNALKDCYPQVDVGYLCEIWCTNGAEGINPLKKAGYVPQYNGDKSKSIEYIHMGGRDHLVVNGMNNLILKLKKNVKSILSAKVIKVHQKKTKTVIHYIKDGKTETINADYIINTTPWWALKAGEIKCTPAISKAKTEAMKKVEIKRVMKVALSFNRHAFISAVKQANNPLRENILVIDSYENGLGSLFAVNMNAISYLGKSWLCRSFAKLISLFTTYDPVFLEQYFYTKMMSHIKFTNISPTILFFLDHNQTVEKLSGMNDKTVVNTCIEALKKYYPSLTPTSLTDSRVVLWTQDQFFAGAYPRLTSSMNYNDLEALCAPEGNMFFAGDGLGIEHDKTDSGHIKIQHSSLHAAMTSGQNAAHEIIRLLNA